MSRFFNYGLVMFELSLMLSLFPNSFAQTTYPHGKEFRIECNRCHNTDSWEVNQAKINFDHKETGFGLYGQHSNLLCSDCHTSLKFNEISNDCFSCHVDAHKNTLGLDCRKCHNENSWKQVNMQQIHDQFRFPLTGVHNIDNCEQCHINSRNFIFENASTNCIDCHKEDYNMAANPLHVVMGFSKNCEECHTLQSVNWRAEKFKHTALSFAGAHVNLSCNQCHNQTHQGYTQECIGCHNNDFIKAVDPPHVSENYPHECTSCHNTTSWVGAQFNHNQTGFSLTGSHKNVECKSCHQTGYAGTSVLCSNCHASAFSTAPQHVLLSYPQTCEMCHNTTAWNQTTFDHSSTGFLLTGSHANVNCSTCHINGFTGTPNQCFSCHESAFNSAPDHLQKGYPHTCETCHNTTVWNQVTFDHNSTAFALTGAHKNVNCSECHSSGFAGTSKLCQNCHTIDYNNTTNPSHKGLNLSVNCEQCHTTNPGWTPAQFPIHNNYFVFAGAHINIQNNCNGCHNGNYNNTPNTCYGCHQNDYNNTTNPQHSSVRFPQTCNDCHSETAWIPATFDHDNRYFPIYSGVHNRRWSNCSDCHTVSSDYKIFSCIDCHEHNKSETDSHHQDVSGYSYNSSECYRCHPGGSSEGLMKALQRIRVNAK